MAVILGIGMYIRMVYMLMHFQPSVIRCGGIGVITHTALCGVGVDGIVNITDGEGIIPVTGVVGTVATGVVIGDIIIIMAGIQTGDIMVIGHGTVILTVVHSELPTVILQIPVVHIPVRDRLLAQV